MNGNYIFILLILFMIGLVFMSTRQRKKQEQQAKSLQNSLSVGDVVVMTSGISGTVVDVDDERTIDLEIAPDVITTWLRAAVREKLVAEDDGVEELTGSHEAIEPDETPASPNGTAHGTATNGVSSNGHASEAPSSVSDAPSDAKSAGSDDKSDITTESSDGASSPRSS